MNAAEAFRSRWDNPSFGVPKLNLYGKKWNALSYYRSLAILDAATLEQRLHDAAEENNIDQVHNFLQAGATVPIVSAQFAMNFKKFLRSPDGEIPLQHTFALCCIEGHEVLVRIFLQELLAKFPESQHLFKCLNFLFTLRARSWRRIMYRVGWQFFFNSDA